MTIGTAGGANATMANRHGLCAVPGETSGRWPEAKQVKEPQWHGFNPKTVRGDRGYHAEHFVHGLRELEVVLYPSSVGRALRVVCTAAHRASQSVRERIEEIFGWTKMSECLRKTRYRGVDCTYAQQHTWWLRAF